MMTGPKRLVSHVNPVFTQIKLTKLRAGGVVVLWILLLTPDILHVFNVALEMLLMQVILVVTHHHLECHVAWELIFPELHVLIVKLELM